MYAPGIAGVFLVWRHYGLEGLGSFFKLFDAVRAPVKWWLFLILGILGGCLHWCRYQGTIGDPFSFTTWSALLPALALALFSALSKSLAGAELPCPPATPIRPDLGRPDYWHHHCRLAHPRVLAERIAYEQLVLYPFISAELSQSTSS